MPFLSRFRPKRRDAGGSAKFLYLTDKQLVYQHITAPGSAPIEPRLDQFYRQLEVLHSERNSALRGYAALFAACVLVQFDVIVGFSAGGVSLLPIALKHVFLMGYAVTQLRVSIIQAKYNYISGIFEHRFYSSTPPVRADMLARYPLALDVMKFYVGQIGTLPHTASMRLPKRMVSMLLLLVMGLIVYISFSIWLFTGLSIDVWHADSPLPVFWSRASVIVSVGLALASYLMPTDLLFKRSYMHVGLAEMMNRAHETDRPRYMRYFHWINRLNAP